MDQDSYVLQSRRILLPTFYCLMVFLVRSFCSNYNAKVMINEKVYIFLYKKIEEQSCSPIIGLIVVIIFITQLLLCKPERFDLLHVEFHLALSLRWYMSMSSVESGSCMLHANPLYHRCLRGIVRPLPLFRQEE